MRHEASAVLCRLGAAARGEDEREGPVVADLLDHCHGLQEVLLGLAREANDDVRRERHVGEVLAALNAENLHDERNGDLSESPRNKSGHP